MFRYWADEVQSDGTVRTLRKYREIGPSRGEGALTKKQAEIERDNFLAKLNATTPEEVFQHVASTGVALLRHVAEMYEQGYLSRTQQIGKAMREKDTFYLGRYIVPRWGDLRLNQIQPQAVEDWLHATFGSWWTMHAVRAIMGRVYRYAEGQGFWEEGKRSPVAKAKLGKKRHKRERRIPSFDETAGVLEKLEEPNRLIIETCIATGARISEVLGLKWKHVDYDAATIKIEQRIWHQEVAPPKSEGSRRVLGIGDLADRFRARAIGQGAAPEGWVFSQKRAPERPLWDSSVRQALHQAAQHVGCDFPGLGPHSFRRANITWRQQVGASSLEASKIAGHADLEMTSEYTFVSPERQNELTRRIQMKLAQARTPGPAPSGPAVVSAEPSSAGGGTVDAADRTKKVRRMVAAAVLRTLRRRAGKVVEFPRQKPA